MAINLNGEKRKGRTEKELAAAAAPNSTQPNRIAENAFSKAICSGKIFIVWTNVSARIKNIQAIFVSEINNNNTSNNNNSEQTTGEHTFWTVGQRRLLHKCAFRYALLFLIHIWILERRRVPRFKKPVYKRIHTLIQTLSHSQTLGIEFDSNRIGSLWIELKLNWTEPNRTVRPAIQNVSVILYFIGYSLFVVVFFFPVLFAFVFLNLRPFRYIL